MSSYIGSQISLISTSDVRYEGILHSIDPTESTIALKNVRHMGTEDRRTDNVIEASSTVYEYIIFSGENIKNLKLVEQEVENDIINDPAILEVKQKQAPVEFPEQQQWINEGSNIGRGNWNASSGRGNLPIWNHGANYFQEGYQTRGYWNDGQFAHGGRGGGYNMGNYNHNYGYPQNDWTYRPQSARGRDTTRNIRRGGQRSQRSNRYEDKNSQKYIPGTGKFLERATNDDTELVVPDKEFDFQGNLALFDMTTLKKALTEETQKTSEKEPNEPKTENKDEKIETKEEKTGQDLWDENSKEYITQDLGCAYDKENFFDSLSTNSDVYNSQTGEDMKQQNVETFGQIGATYQARTRWFRRWSGRGRREMFGAAHSERK